MSRSRLLLFLAVVSGGLGVPLLARDALFRRGDANQDGALDLSDATRTLGFLFLGTGSIDCRDAADANDDGGLDIADPIHTLGFLFVGTAPPPAPFEECGADPSSDRLGCESFAACEQPPPAGEGLFGEAVSYDTVGGGAVVLDDLDGDGALDLVVARFTLQTLVVGLGRGDGTFGKPVEQGVRRHAISVAAGDLDGDGALDLVVGSQEDITVLPGVGDGTFGEAASYDVNHSFVACVALDDLDGDGVLDLAAANHTNDEVSVLLGVGDGSFRDREAYPIAGAVSLALGDLDGDGVLDLAALGANGVSVLRGVGDGTFGEPVLVGRGEPIQLAAIGRPAGAI